MVGMKALWFPVLAIFLFTACETTGRKTPLPSPARRYTVYLTTDDGPLGGSQNINRIVAEEKVPMTAFIIGKHAASKSHAAYVENYKRNRYIDIANHSFTHADSHYLRYYRNPGLVLNDFEKNRAYYRLSGTMSRLPGRNSWRLGGSAYDQDRTSTKAASLLAASGYRLYGWDLEWTHTNSGKPIGDAKSIYRKIIYKLKNNRLFTKGHLILLMHDQMFRSAYAAGELRKLIEMLKNDPTIKLAQLRSYPLPRCASAQEKQTCKAKKPSYSSSRGLGERTQQNLRRYAAKP